MAVIFLTLGCLFLAGLLADEIGRRTRLPRVTLLIGCGVLAGGSGLDVIPAEARYWYEFFSITALTVVAFLLGSSLTVTTLRRHGRGILSVSLGVALVTVAGVSGGLWLLGCDPALALLLGAVAAATDPAATEDVIAQTGARGGFVETLEGIVAIDDAWGLILFSVLAVVAAQLNGQGGGSVLGHSGWELGGSVLLGLAVGLPAAFLSGRIRPGEPTQAEALAIVFLCAGLAIWLEVSFLVAGMTAGTVIVNCARHHTRAFHEIEHLQWPFMILFFVLAGASLDFGELAAAGLIGAAFMVLRVGARLAGGWLGATLGAVPRAERPWYGLALMPQAGVAVGMALVAGEQFPELKSTLLTITLGSTVVFELLGPPATLYAIGRAGGQRD